MSLLRSSRNVLQLAKSLSSGLTLTVAAPTCRRAVHRWVSPTLRELRKRTHKLGPQAPQPRSGFIEWNYRAELFAFGKRLQEEFQLPMLQSAFTQRSYISQEQQRQRELGIEEVDLQMSDNSVLAARGVVLTREYIAAYLQHSLPLVPAEGRSAFTDYLLSETTLAHVASQLGMRELILAAEYPPSAESLAQSLLAVVGALEAGSVAEGGAERAFLFVRDFVCTQLNQRDLLELWLIEQPEALLRQVCAERQLPEPEPRLLGDCGRNTVLAAYHVGVYANKQIIGKGFGEDIPTAVSTASLNALQKLFGIEDSMRPFNFQLQVEPKSVKLTQN